MVKKDKSLISHFSELRQRIVNVGVFFVICCLCFYPFSNNLFEFILEITRGSLNLELIAIEVASPFLAPLRLVLFVSFLLTIPFLIFHSLSFMSPGLYEHEKKFIYSRSIIGLLLFLFGLAFSITIVIPNALYFFESVSPDSLTVTTDISKYLGFIMTITASFGLAFQVPLIVNALIYFDIFDKAKIKSFRGVTLITMFFFGMVLTPPDVISQIFLALPMYLLFEIGLLLSNEKKKPSS